MDSVVGFDSVKFEKAKAMERFNRFRKITKTWQVFEVFLFFSLVSWSSTRVSSVPKISGHFVFETSSYLLNHHVVFLIGNFIIILLFVLCRQSAAGNVVGTGDFYDDYVKHPETGKGNSSVRELEPTAPPVMAEVATVEGGGGDYEEKQIIMSPESMENDDVAMAIENASRQIRKLQRKKTESMENDDAAMAIENASRQIRKLQRTKTEKLKREITVKPKRELRRSETEICQKIVSSGQRQTKGSTSFDGTEIDSLSNEEFQKTVDAFIQEQWNKISQNKRVSMSYRSSITTGWKCEVEA